jgi:nicotinamidase-related amidase
MPRALLVIDVQNEYFTGALPVTHPVGHLANVLAVMDAARAAGVPTVVVRHAQPDPNAPVFRKGSTEWELHDAVAARPRDLLLDKQLPGCFTHTELDEWLKARGTDTVTVAGYMTQVCCDTTARQAMHLGYKVEFLSDATGTLPVTNAAGSVTAEELHRAILVAQQMFISEVIDSATWQKRL